jgi:2-methylisocitrate lyase-like PEP mutase family enzyme
VTPVIDAAALRALHRPGDPLVLPNVWDAGSARVVAAAGFGAVATSSGAVAESLGYADHEATPVGEMLDAIARISAAVSVPVTADFERGYGLRPADLVERLAAAGAVGMNLEDSDPATGVLIDADKHADFLGAVVEAGRLTGIDLVLNARIDVYIREEGRWSARERLDEAIRRAGLYRAAGADCVYPIVLASRPDIATFVDEVRAPVNVITSTSEPNLSALAELGVARISFGSGVYRATQKHLTDVVARIAG